jgi:hypothetical protein
MQSASPILLALARRGNRRFPLIEKVPHPSVKDLQKGGRAIRERRDAPVKSMLNPTP